MTNGWGGILAHSSPAPGQAPYGLNGPPKALLPRNPGSKQSTSASTIWGLRFHGILAHSSPTARNRVGRLAIRLEWATQGFVAKKSGVQAKHFGVNYLGTSLPRHSSPLKPHGTLHGRPGQAGQAPYGLNGPPTGFVAGVHQRAIWGVTETVPRGSVFVLPAPISGIMKPLWRSELTATVAVCAGGKLRVSPDEATRTGIDPDPQPSP